MIPNKTYTFAKEQYVLKCAAGYVYPKGSKQRDQGRQTLVCDGTTNKYNDVDDGRTGIQPLACEEAKGCSEIKQPKEAEVSKSGCSFNDPYYNDKCELTINCQNGKWSTSISSLRDSIQVSTRKISMLWSIKDRRSCVMKRKIHGRLWEENQSKLRLNVFKDVKRSISR